MIQKRQTQIWFLFILILMIMLLSFFQQTIRRFLLKSRAEGNELTVKLKLQGHFEQIQIPSYKTKVVLYTSEGKAKELSDQQLTKDAENFFKLLVSLGDLDLAKLYAVFIKPDKYVGKIFCSSNQTGADCKSPAIILKPRQNNLDLSQFTFLSGDLQVQDGKVSAFDLSKIIKDLGKITNDYLESDVNGDRVVDTVDYSLALYSLGQNAGDDVVNFASASASPTPSQTISPTPDLTVTPTHSSQLTPTPTSPTTPTPTQSQSQAGTCNSTLNGKIYVNAGVFGQKCRVLDNEQHHYCVINQSECNATSCLAKFKETAKQILPACSNGLATLDEQKTQVDCQTQFSQGACTPEPTPGCEDNRPAC